MFPTGGEAHKNGIKNEIEIVNTINENYKKKNDLFDVYPEILKKGGSIGIIDCIHKGGTAEKADAILICGNKERNAFCKFTISIKRKQYSGGKAEGTYDIINTTLKKFSQDYGIAEKEKVDAIINYLDSQKPLVKTKEDLKSIKTQFANLCNALMESLEQNAQSFYDLVRSEFYKTDYFVVGKVVDEKLVEVFYKKESELKLADVPNLDLCTFKLKKRRNAKFSRTLYAVTPDGNEHPTPFRVRCGLNNGYSAYYGLSNANDTSILSIKIQVDDVEFFAVQMNSLKIH